MNTVSRLFQSISQKLSPATGRFYATKFVANCPQGPVTDAVKFTNEVRKGSEILSCKVSARVDFKNGSSLLSDGQKVTVFDSAGQPTRVFPGSVEVSHEHVLVKDISGSREQSFGADGSNLFFDGDRIVELDPGLGAHGIFRDGAREPGVVKDEAVIFPSGERVFPIFSQEWLIS